MTDIQEFDMFRTITPKELLVESWNKQTLAEKAPNLWKLITRFNQFSSWVSYSIVKEENLKKRSALVVKFLRIAKECKNLNNYNAIFEITSGLQQSAVHRLKKTWEVCFFRI